MFASVFLVARVADVLVALVHPILLLPIVLKALCSLLPTLGQPLNRLKYDRVNSAIAFYNKSVYLFGGL